MKEERWASSDEEESKENLHGSIPFRICLLPIGELSAKRRCNREFLVDSTGASRVTCSNSTAAVINCSRDNFIWKTTQGQLMTRKRPHMSNAVAQSVTTARFQTAYSGCYR